MTRRSQRIRRQAQVIRRRWPDRAEGVYIVPTRFAPQSKRLMFARWQPEAYRRKACLERTEQ